MKWIKMFKKSKKGSVTLMVLTTMMFVLLILTASYFAISNKSRDQDKKISQIVEQYRASDEDMEQEYQKVVNNLRVEDYVNIGDYVDYNPTIATKDGQSVDANKLSYTSQTGTATEHGNGYTSTEEGGGQTFTANSNIKWRVLSIEDGNVELISENVVQTNDNSNFVLSGARGYLYAEQELNEICKIYGYGYGADTTKGGTYTVGGPLDTPINKKIEGTGARSITIEDINKKAGIVLESDYKELNSEYGRTDLPQLEVYYPTLDANRGNNITGVSTLPEVKELKFTGYQYTKERITDINIQNMLVNGNYWLSNRKISTGSYAYFSVCTVYDRFISGNDLFAGGDYKFVELTKSDYGIRPIVNLKANTIDLSINYDKDNIWRLK